MWNDDLCSRLRSVPMTNQGVRFSRESDNTRPVQHVQIVMGSLEVNADSL